MVADYNRHMCYYGLAKKMRKWWKHIAFHLIDMDILNVYIIFCSNTNGIMDQLQFRLHVAEKLAILVKAFVTSSIL